MNDTSRSHNQTLAGKPGADGARGVQSGSGSLAAGLPQRVSLAGSEEAAHQPAGLRRSRKDRSARLGGVELSRMLRRQRRASERRRGVGIVGQPQGQPLAGAVEMAAALGILTF